MRRSFLTLVAAAILVAGCSYLPGPRLGSMRSDNPCTSGGSLPRPVARRCNEAALRQAAVAVETYYADHGTYAGMTLADLNAYDPTIVGIRIARASASRYCIETRLAHETFSAHGPPPRFSAGGC